MNLVNQLLSPDELSCLRAIMVVGTERAQSLVNFHAQLIDQPAVKPSLPKKELKLLSKKADLLDKAFPQLAAHNPGRKVSSESACNQVTRVIHDYLKSGPKGRQEVLAEVKKKFPNLKITAITFKNYTNNCPGVKRDYGMWSLK